MSAEDLSDGVLLVVILGVILFLGVSILSTTAGVTISQTNGGERIQTSQTLNGGGTWHTLDSHQGINDKVTTSRGYAIQLTGASDSYFQSSQRFNISSDANWSVSVWANVDSASATENMTVVSLDGRLVITYNGSASEWRAWYYDDGSRTSYNTSVPAPNQPNSFTHLVVARNQTHLQLHRNNTISSTVNVTTESFADAPVNATQFDGAIEELRVLDTTLSDQQRQNLYANPVQPYTYNRSARVMFDEPYRNQQLLLFAPGHIDTSNVTYSQGFDGRELSGSEYDWDETGPRIRVESTILPVVYIDYTTSGIGTIEYLQSIASALVLAGLLVILVAVGIVIYALGHSDPR